VYSCCSSSVFCVFIFFTLINVLPLLFYCFFLNLFLLFFLSILIYEFSPFSYTLVCYKNVETLFTDRVRNVVITKSPDKDMIVADQMNQVNLSCEAEGNPSISFIWYKEPDMNNQLSTEHLLMIILIVILTVPVMVYTYLLSRWQFQSWYIPTYCKVDSFSHRIYSPIVELTVSVMIYAHLL
jgi:hypothetical protein